MPQREGTTDRRQEIIAELERWLAERLDKMQFGEVGFSVVVHNGQIKQARKIDQERIEA